ncbi:MAG TPA: tetratricopeptide repeat protein [bacterium]|nr:tetratricopeptide repeat protein [bacterium]
MGMIGLVRWMACRRHRVHVPAAILMGLALAGGLGSCAYYNIYWTASHEYQKATAGQSSAEFWDPFEQKPLSGENLKTIDSCAKRCGKILLLYPKSKWVDDALVLMGNCFTLKGDYANALRKYEELLKFYPSSEYVDEAMYMEAYTRVLDGSPQQALASLQDMEDQVKAKLWREHILFLAARIFRKNGDCDGAIDYYRAYLKDFPEGRKATEVTLALADCLIKTDKQGEATGLLEPLAAKQGLAGSVAAIKLGAAYRKLGEDDKALGIFRTLADKSLVDSVRARADIETAITLEGQGKPQDAVGVLTTADSLGKASLGGEAQYRIGLIYEQRLGDFAKATTAYDDAGKVATDYGKLAARRSLALKSVAKYEQVLSDSTVRDPDKLAMNRFSLAETFLIDLGLTARAEAELRTLSDSLPTNTFTARSKLTLGSLLEARGDTTARIYYRAVIDSFPTTVYANIARSRLDMPLIDVPEKPAPAPAQETQVEKPRAVAPGESPGQPTGVPGAPATTTGEAQSTMIGPMPPGEEGGTPGATSATMIGPMPPAPESSGAQSTMIGPTPPAPEGSGAQSTMIGPMPPAPESGAPATTPGPTPSIMIGPLPPASGPSGPADTGHAPGPPPQDSTGVLGNPPGGQR